MKKFNVLLTIVTLLLMSFLIFGCEKKQPEQKGDSSFETGYEDVTINKETMQANKGVIYGFYEDEGFTKEVAEPQKATTKLYVKLLVGSGTEEDPYLIESSNSLMSLTHLGKEVTGFAKIMKDFTASSIYTSDYEKTTFSGTLDGNGHHIHLNEEHPESVNTGLIYKVGEEGVVKNISIHGPLNATQASTGALCNYNYGVIDNINTYGTTLHASNGYNNGVSLMTVWDEETGTVSIDHGTVGLLSTLSKGGAGGISGTNYGIIRNCINRMNNKATIGAGGISGINYGLITNCFNAGAVGTTGNNAVNSTTIRDHTFDFSYLGGISGANYGTIRQCVNSNQVFVARLPWKFDDAPAGQSDYINRIRIGGIAGANFGEYDDESDSYVAGIITECANYGRVHGDMQVGGIAGYTSGYIADCEVISPIGARSCLGGIAGWQSGDKAGDRIPVVTNCLAITRVAAGSNQAVVDEAGNSYTAVKLIQLSSSVSVTNIDEYYHIAKYATNCIYHNYGGTSYPIDPATGLQDTASKSTTATMSSSVHDVVALKNGENTGLWIDFIATDSSDCTAIVGFNTSWQAYLSEYLKWQAKTITYVVNGESTTIKAVAGVNYITTVVTKSGGNYVSGLASNYSAAIVDRALPLNPITIGSGEKLIWVTTAGDASTEWDGLVTSDITIYPMAVKAGE